MLCRPGFTLGNRYVRFGAGALVLALAACGGGSDGAAENGATPAAADMTGGELQTVSLSQNDVEDWIAATSELHNIGVRADKSMGDDPGNVRNAFKSMQFTAEAMAVLRKHRFDVVRYQQVSYSIMAALAAAEIQANEPQNEDAMAQLEAMKGQIPAEQYESMRQAMQASQATMKAMADQPQGNIDLVARYKQQIEDISK